MASAISTTSFLLNSSCSPSNLLFSINFCSSIHFSSCRSRAETPAFHPLFLKRKDSNFICRAEKEYKFLTQFQNLLILETEKFKSHLVKKLSKKDMFGDSIDDVVGICTEIFSNFLHTEYGGPGTLLVIPFIDMADTINERGLPGGPQAARAAVKWAQAYVDKDWKEWTSS